MPVPKKRQSASRQGKRRATWKLKAINLSICPDCHAPVLPHRACPSCGTYQGRKVLEIEAKEAPKEKATETKKSKGKEK